MTVTDQERKDIITQDREFRKKMAFEWRETNDAIVERYNAEIKKYGTEEKAIEVVCDAFGVGRRRVKNAIMRQLGTNNPGLQAMTGAMILGQIAKLMGDVGDAQDNLQYELDQLDDLEENGAEWVEVEETEDTGGKFGMKIVTKKVSIAEKRKKLLADKVEMSQVFFNSIKALLPQSVVNATIDNRRIGDELGVMELEKMIREAKGEVFERE